MLVPWTLLSGYKWNYASVWIKSEHLYAFFITVLWDSCSSRNVCDMPAPHHCNDVIWTYKWWLKSLATWPCSTACLGYQERKYQSSILLAFCEGNPTVTGGFSLQMANDMENTSMSRCHHMKQNLNMITSAQICEISRNVMLHTI